MPRIKRQIYLADIRVGFYDFPVVRYDGKDKSFH